MFNSIRAIVSMVADVGVVVGFILIAVQLDQNSKALRNQTEAAISAGFTSAETALIGENGAIAFAKSIHEPENMTSAEITSLWVYYSSSFAPLYVAYDAYKNGTMSEIEYKEQLIGFAVYLTTPFARAWWKAANPMFPSEAVQDIDEAVRNFPDPNFIGRQLETLKAELMRTVEADSL